MTVRTVASWTCETCRIDETDTGIACHKAAEKHIAATGHTTVTHLRPVEGER